MLWNSQWILWSHKPIFCFSKFLNLQIHVSDCKFYSPRRDATWRSAQSMKILMVKKLSKLAGHTTYVKEGNPRWQSWIRDQQSSSCNLMLMGWIPLVLTMCSNIPFERVHVLILYKGFQQLTRIYIVDWKCCFD